VGLRGVRQAGGEAVTYGFVYILVNDYMTAFKVGCTERSPHARAEELSKATGVPAPFRVLCYIEVPEFQSVERDLHKWLDEHRVSPGREFFDDGALAHAVRLMLWHRKRLSFVEPQEYGDCQDCGQTAEYTAYGNPDRDPWAPQPQSPAAEPQPEESAAAPLRLVSNGDEEPF
jgi:hypothetical protein